MMKKVLLAVLGIALFAGVSDAQQRSSRTMVFDQVFFRTSAANDAGFVDSLGFNSVGAAGASSVLDTTAAISTAGWEIACGGDAAGDSSVFAKFIVYDAPDGDCESGADSLGVAMQVSADGVTWATCAVVAGQTGSGTAVIATRNNQTIANGVFLDKISDNGAALANGQPIWSFPLKMRGNASLGSLDHGSALLFPYIRFITSSHDAKGYKVRAKIGHFTNNVQ